MCLFTALTYTCYGLPLFVSYSTASKVLRRSLRFECQSQGLQTSSLVHFSSCCVHACQSEPAQPTLSSHFEAPFKRHQAGAKKTVHESVAKRNNVFLLCLRRADHSNFVHSSGPVVVVGLFSKTCHTLAKLQPPLSEVFCSRGASCRRAGRSPGLLGRCPFKDT